MNETNSVLKLLSVVGARPNFMKIAPLVRAVNRYNQTNGNTEVSRIDHTVVHTGQHYDNKMSDNFFRDLGIGQPEINLGIGSGSHAEQVGKTMIAFEKVVRKLQPDWVIVVGDVNATCACSVTAKKECIKLAHIEAGLRSGDMAMPEEINRLVTDRLADLLLTPDKISNQNLQAEGVAEEKIEFVGNIMIDTLEHNRAKAEKLNFNQIVTDNLLPGQQLMPGLNSNSAYGLLTIHRPSNVDDPMVLKAIVTFLMEEASKKLPLIWAIHPRTRKNLENAGLFNDILNNERLLVVEPLGYLQMLRLNMQAAIMLTDSGGLQEECCVLGTPCLTLRWNTERPVTLREHGGASVLVGNAIDNIRSEFFRTLAQKRTPQRPELWDGKTAERIVRCLVERRVEKETAVV
ncbi:UDP-N-acetylglucosamine 2-epimerase [Chitinispirillum alkaliphilum]|nr:UDP-N-acetylglucosamine 2-epimerase [Chitinispirillum alkaliphilum]